VCATTFIPGPQGWFREQRTESGSGTREARSHRPDRDAKCNGSLLVGELFPDAQCDHFLVGLGKGVDRADDLVEPEAVVEASGDVVGGIGLVTSPDQ